MSSSASLTKLDIEYLKRVFEDNERLRLEMDKLIDNIQHSRNDMQRVASISSAAVKDFPAMLSQQYKASKDSYD